MSEVLEVLPAAPVDGQVVYYGPAAINFVWELKYSSRPGLWCYMGGYNKEAGSQAEYEADKSKGPYS